MSDMLNEKFEEFASEHASVLSEAGQDPMPTVTAAVLPGDAAATGQSNTAVNAKASAGEGASGHAAPIQPGVAIGQAAPQEVNSVTTTPHEHDEDGDENPGAKAAAPIGGGISGEPNRGASNTDLPNGTAPTFGAEIAYGTKMGGSVTYPIKPKFESVDMSADVAALTEGTELTEDFAAKAKTIFEAAVTSKLNEEWTKLEESFATQLAEAVEVSKKELAEEVNGTLNYAVTKWLEENQVAVDRGIKNEISEDFIAGLKNLFEEHYISVPDEKVDVLEGLSEDLCKMEERLDEQVKRNIELQNRLGESSKQVIVNLVSEGLADTQKEKLASLADGVEFTTEEEFSKKLTTIKESYFTKDSVIKAEVTDETPVEGSVDDISPAMAQYINAMNRWNQ
ncbi:prohead assembly scaffold protein [Cyanophage S-RIM44]|uniref:Scaffold prohead core protein n=3 Tax=Vellamovirus TaxID=2733139 RepID=E3SPK8_9CAUD|nr:head scaffolding protein [Prochlorococcus phage Syn1]ADO99224.1 scaffold prohead core protein [Prochlorococcus phage Syn1]AOO11838.1 prohead assembly scaffold protein [Cyanophage S-RIM44]